MQRLLENWRRYNKNIEEIRLMQESEKHRIIREYDVPSKEAYGASFEDFKSQLEEFSDATWIFFDTETTGLNADKDFNQITQIAAIAVDVKGFKEDPVILEKFNVKVRLTGRTKSFMGWERGKQKERAKSGQASNFKTIPDIFKMTGYGVARDPEKAKRKAYLSAPEGTSMNDVPEQVEFKHGKEALESFQAFLEKYEYRILVAQNAPFDARFIKKMYQRIGMRTTQDTIIDTVQIFKQFLSPVLKRYKKDLDAGMDIAPENKKILDALTAKNKAGKDYLTVSLGKLIKAFDVENKGWHDALADVTMLLDVLKAILDYLSSQEAPNIEQSKETTDTSQLSLSL